MCILGLMESSGHTEALLPLMRLLARIQDCKWSIYLLLSIPPGHNRPCGSSERLAEPWLAP